MKVYTYLCGAVAVAVTAGTASATIVNVDSLQPSGTSSTFGPGTYTVTFVGPSTAGALYAGWNPYGAGSNCTTASATCQGYTDRVAIGFGLTYTTAFTQYETSDGFYYGTPAAALAAMQAAESNGSLIGYQNDVTATPVVGPISFTLTAPTEVGFFLRDSYYGDNAGGVSLSVDRATTGTVPEPASWALMLAGFGVVGATMRRRATAVSVAA